MKTRRFLIGALNKLTKRKSHLQLTGDEGHVRLHETIVSMYEANAPERNFLTGVEYRSS